METKKKEREILLFFSLIFVSLILIGLDKLSWLNWLKRPIENLSNPVKEKIQRINKSFKSQPQQNLLVWQEKTEHLERENAELKVKLKDLEQENTSMKKLLGAPLPPSWKFIPAKVLNIKDGIMTINQGSDIGIKENQIVVFENILIGRIIKVNPRLSKIMLPIHKDSNIKAKIIGTNVKGIVKSEAGNLLVLDEVLQEVSLTKDQIIVTSAEDEIYPLNLLIGKIDSIEKNETAIYQKAVIQPLVDYKKLDQVFVVKI